MTTCLYQATVNRPLDEELNVTLKALLTQFLLWQLL